MQTVGQVLAKEEAKYPMRWHWRRPGVGVGKAIAARLLRLGHALKEPEMISLGKQLMEAMQEVEAELKRADRT